MMSTPAIWLFVVLGLVFVVMIVVVVRAGRVVSRKARTLSTEMDGLLEELDTAVGSIASGSACPPGQRGDETESSTAYSGYHRRDAPRQEEVDHG